MKTVLLSFDIEEFDMPMEYQIPIDFHDQINISKEGTKRILNILDSYDIKATFFSTVVFASHSNELISRIITSGHELASHTYFHSSFKDEHILMSRMELESISGSRVTGLRMPRMMPVNEALLVDAGYEYNSSLNPTYLPGRYNNFNEPRSAFRRNGLLNLPASVSPFVRFPLFWLSFHNLPGAIYKSICKITMNYDGYLNLYYHPWEFTDLSTSKLPYYVKKNSGDHMVSRFKSLIEWMVDQGYRFSTISNFLNSSYK